MGYISEITNSKDVMTLASGTFNDGIFEFYFCATMNVYLSKSYECPGLFSRDIRKNMED